MKRAFTILGIIAVAFVAFELFAADPPTGLAKSPTPASTIATSNEAAGSPEKAMAAAPAKPLPDLESVKAAKAAAAEPPRLPVYVIPEAIAVQTPIGVIVFAERWHVEELAKKFPSHRLTNIIVWSH